MVRLFSRRYGLYIVTSDEFAFFSLLLLVLIFLILLW